jgi:hypothetical protein
MAQRLIDGMTVGLYSLMSILSESVTTGSEVRSAAAHGDADASWLMESNPQCIKDAYATLAKEMHRLGRIDKYYLPMSIDIEHPVLSAIWMSCFCDELGVAEEAQNVILLARWSDDSKIFK